MLGNLTQAGVFKLFHQVTHSLRRAPNLHLMLKDAAQTMGWGFELDRCVILLFDEAQQEIQIRSEFNRDASDMLGQRRYQLSTNSEWYRLLLEGRPLPLKEIRLEGGKQGSTPELDQFVIDSHSESLTAFPLVYQGRLIGCLTMHQFKDGKSLSDDLLEVGEAVAEELAVAVAHAWADKEKDVESSIFRESALPMLVLDPDSFRILQANQSCTELLSSGSQDLKGLSFLELLAESDSKRLGDAIRALNAGQPAIVLEGLVARAAAGGALHNLRVSASHVKSDSQSSILLSFIPSPDESSTRAGADARHLSETSAAGKLEELVKRLSKQLNWERNARHIISVLHSSLDRDMVLQSTADLLGRALGASSCLVVRTDGPASPTVTHEYVEADLSPLGLGRTSQFPLTAISAFRHKTMAISDISTDQRLPGLSPEDLEELLDGGVTAMLGTPISHHGFTHGIAVVIQTGRSRQWDAAEIEIVEAIAEQAAIALNHAQSYAQTKDQLFNMNLIGNLTQQLTNALDLAARVGKPEATPEAAKQPGPTTPLSLRELEVLKLIASGLANREIAQRLFLTESTVELHASRIRKKLKLKSRTALVKYACDNHLV